MLQSLQHQQRQQKLRKKAMTAEEADGAPVKPRRTKKKPPPAAVNGSSELPEPTPAVDGDLPAAPKPRKKKRAGHSSTPADDDMEKQQTIETLRSSLEKSSGDQLMEKNTFDPGRSPKKALKGVNSSGVDNGAFQDENGRDADDAAGEVPKKPRRRRSAAPPAEADQQQQLESESAEPAQAQPKPRTKKRRPVASAASAEESATITDETAGTVPSAQPRLRKKRQPVSADVTDTAEVNEEATVHVEDETHEEPQVQRRRKLKKKKATASGDATDDAVITEQPRASSAASLTPAADATEAEAGEQQQQQQQSAMDLEDEGRVMQITVHRADQLKNDTHIRHPLIRLHIVDISTGQYLAKQHADRKVTSFYESVDVQYVLPVMTAKCDFKRQGNTLPVWEERLVLDENYDYLVRNPNSLMLFEVLDMLSASAIQNNRVDNPEAGWYRIAWAFLKPLSKTGRLHCEQKLRLQLYEPISLRSADTDDPMSPYLFKWYRDRARVPYPATMYVTIKPIELMRNNELETSRRLRAQFPYEAEIGTRTFNDLSGHAGGDGDEDERRRLGMPEVRKRVAGQLCKIPNRVARTLPTGTLGCSALRFSPDGKWLAAGCRSPPDFPVVLYSYSDVHSQIKTEATMIGHAGIVYDLGWSRKSQFLVSAAGDCSARVWSIAHRHMHKQMVHPAFVYCAQFHPHSSSLIATGCYDRVLRVWNIFESTCEVVWQLDGHAAHINSIVFEPEGKYLYSGDSNGGVIEWRTPYTAGVEQSGVGAEWSLSNRLELPEIKEKCITCLAMHPTGSRLLVQTRDSSLRMVHVRSSKRGCVIVDYMGHLNSRENLKCCISPCGAFIIVGSEDGDVYVYNSDSGDVVATYRQVNLSGAVNSVDYHPHDNALAFSALSHSAAVLIYQYDSALARRDGLNLGRSGALVSVGDAVQELEASRIRQSGPLLEEVGRLRSMRLANTEHDDRKSRMAHERLESVTSTARGSMRPPLGASTFGASLNANLTSLPGTVDSITPRHLQSTEIGRHGLIGAEKPRLTLIIDGPNRASFRVDKPTKRQQASTAAAAGDAAATPAAAVASPRDSEFVIAIFDYKAQRSDEISFSKGQRIKILLKDSASWWLGELQLTPEQQQSALVNTQGYFPTSYVISEKASRAASLAGSRPPSPGRSALRSTRFQEPPQPAAEQAAESTA